MKIILNIEHPDGDVLLHFDDKDNYLTIRQIGVSPDSDFVKPIKVRKKTASEIGQRKIRLQFCPACRRDY